MNFDLALFARFSQAYDSDPVFRKLVDEIAAESVSVKIPLPHPQP